MKLGKYRLDGEVVDTRTYWTHLRNADPGDYEAICDCCGEFDKAENISTTEYNPKTNKEENLWGRICKHCRDTIEVEEIIYTVQQRRREGII